MVEQGLALASYHEGLQVLRGFSLGSLWVLPGLSLVLNWFSLGFPWILSGFSFGCLWVLPGFSMVSTWNAITLSSGADASDDWALRPDCPDSSQTGSLSRFQGSFVNALFLHSSIFSIHLPIHPFSSTCLGSGRGDPDASPGQPRALRPHWSTVHMAENCTSVLTESLSNCRWANNSGLRSGPTKEARGCPSVSCLSTGPSYWWNSHKSRETRHNRTCSVTETLDSNWLLLVLAGVAAVDVE